MHMFRCPRAVSALVAGCLSVAMICSAAPASNVGGGGGRGGSGAGFVPSGLLGEGCPGDGSCFLPHGGIGCSDGDCCEIVCDIDPFCCDAGWDLLCVGVALFHCGGGCCFEDGSCFLKPEPLCDLFGGDFQGAGVDCDPSPCTGTIGACCFVGGLCDHLTEDECDSQGGVYQGDDTLCAISYQANGNGSIICPELPCGPGNGDCFSSHSEPGCEDAACCAQICAADPFCCDTAWDSICVEQALASCAGSVCGSATGDCFTPHGGLGCDDPACCALICAADPFCCEVAWDQLCVDQANITCNGADVGACCLPNGWCEQISEEACMEASGMYNGDGTFCEDDDANARGKGGGKGVMCDPVGACCLPDGSCEALTEFGCDQVGGMYNGDFTLCAIDVGAGNGKGFICPVGACCFPDGSCDALTEFGCEQAGGMYNGDFSFCAGEEEDVPFGEFPIDCDEGLPCELAPGRPDPDGSTDRVLRGFIVAFAVDMLNGQEIKWDHLSGSATIVNYRDGLAWEYAPWAHQVVSAATHGQPTNAVDPGLLNLDGLEYAPAFSHLLFDFYAAYSNGFNTPTYTTNIDGDLTLHPATADLSLNTIGPVTTQAVFEVWNENEFKFSGGQRCVTCWDERLLSLYDNPNYFLAANLQTDKGKARIDGVADEECNFDLHGPGGPGTEPDGIPEFISEDAALHGVAMTSLVFNGGEQAASGKNLHGMGTQSAFIRFDPTADPPPSAAGPQFGSFIAPTTGAPAPISTPGEFNAASNNNAAAGAGVQDRVSATEKGSLLYFSKVELRWNAQGELIQDTFISLLNDYPEDVAVQLYFVQGDPPLIEDLEAGCIHDGWDWVDVVLTLTKNEPAYWSAATGLPKGVSPFTILDN